MWIRDWIDAWGLRVHVMDRTMSLAAINVTGPLAKTLLVRAGLADPPRFLGARPRRRRRRPVPRDAPVVHRRGGLRAAPPDRSLRRAVAGAAGAGSRPRHPAARPAGPVRAAAGEGPRHRRHGHRAGLDAAAARDGLGGPDGQAAVHRPGGAGADGEAPDDRRLLRASRWPRRSGAGRGLADLGPTARSSGTSRGAGVPRSSAGPSSSAGRSSRRSSTA